MFNVNINVIVFVIVQKLIKMWLNTKNFIV